MYCQLMSVAVMSEHTWSDWLRGWGTIGCDVLIHDGFIVCDLILSPGASVVAKQDNPSGSIASDSRLAVALYWAHEEL